MARYTLALLLLLPLFASAQEAKKRKPTFTISRDTTYVTGPVDKHGYIDYETALNEILSSGVTPENNAQVLLWQAHGPKPEGLRVPAEFFKWLKIAPPPQKGDYFLGPNEFARARFKADDDVDAKKIAGFSDLLYKLMSRPWTAKEHPDVADWLKQNEKPLAVVIEASKRTRYYYPMISRQPDGKPGHLIGALIPGVQKTRDFVQALTVRAMLRVSEKKHDDAWQDLLACHRLSMRMADGAGSLIESLVAIALDHTASAADIAFLANAKIDSKQLNKCFEDLRKSQPATIGPNGMLAERFIFLQSVMMLDRDGPDSLETMTGKAPRAPVPSKPVAFANWDSTLRKGNQFYSRMVIAMRLKDRTLREKHLQAVDDDIRTLANNNRDLRGKISSFLAADSVPGAFGNTIGDILLALLLPAFTRVQHAADRSEQTHRNLHVAFALAAYKADIGAYPKTLDPLAPKYLTRVPNDLFSGKALIYRPAADGYLFYSVGVNGKDDGGRTYDDDPPGDDLAVRMPARK